MYLDRIVTPQFEGRRWTLPAQVFAQPLELYAGLALSADALEQELVRLHYGSTDVLKRPGTYHRRGSRIDIATRRVQFAEEIREAGTISVLTGQGCYPASAADRWRTRFRSSDSTLS